jgi:uncharacterized protein (DUF608 family)
MGGLSQGGGIRKSARGAFTTFCQNSCNELRERRLATDFTDFTDAEGEEQTRQAEDAVEHR